MASCTGPFYKRNVLSLQILKKPDFLCSVTHSSLRKSKVFDFSVGNWEKVLLLFTMLPGGLYFMLDCGSAFFIAGELEEELNSLLKLQVAKLQKARRETEQTGEQGKKQGRGSPTNQTTRDTNIYCAVR